MKKNIFIYYQDIDSGAKVATEEIIKKLKKNHHYNLIVYKQKPFVHQKRLSFIFNLTNNIKNLVNKLNHSENIDLIYSSAYWSFIAKKLSNKNKKPLVFHFHGDQELTIDSHKINLKFLYILTMKLLVNFLQKKALKKSDFLIFVSKEAKREIIAKYKIIRKNIFVINNGVDLQRFKIVKDKVKNKIKSNLKIKGKTILCSGRIDYKKNIDKVIESLNYLGKNSINLLIAYPTLKDKDSQKYLKKLHSLAIKNRSQKILFIENNQNLEKLYQASDLVILPSQQEMMPLVMLESLACGTSFFGTKVGNIPYIINQIDDNYLLKDIKPETIAKKIQWFLSLDYKTQKKHKLIGLKIASFFSWDKAAGQLFDIFDVALKI